MLDPKFIRENIDLVKRALLNRNSSVNVDDFLAMDEKRRELIKETETLKRDKNSASEEIGKMMRQKLDALSLKEKVNEITKKIESIDNELKNLEESYKKWLEFIPNVPHESVPVGSSEKDNKVVRVHGEIPKFSFTPKDHVELGRLNGLFDFERGVKITGSGFPLFMGMGAKLERALINFMLDIHTKEHGYKEIFPPFVVNRKTMRGTGQIPKMEEDMYKINEEDLFLIPTAEVPVTNIHADEILKEEEMPLYYTAYTPCFRREAGSYGKDTKGLTRVHQFDKVEMVKFVTPSSSMDELEKLVRDAEDILKRLELPYRVIELCTGDISFSAQKCYDIELWAPGAGKWLEVSSCSVFSDFQARRANIKYQPKDKNEKPRLAHTLNGSGVALPRLVIAILEIYQREDGSIAMPKAIKNYFGADTISIGK
ncbi:seryl-tRNA synthase [Candidatus Omnitrophus magneticus]|uniref:Serine--tRNA ligase n=1 Tax=Candidatus Omnitrophus magneticus TaxID=1609969 RepID=A0A0F0CU52_9BACT|nr:seryl-tRNA synthase [Candidatus Omnitrophus magneticus]